MKASTTFAGIALLALSAIPVLADNSFAYVYMRSNSNQPWGQTTNEDAMDNVFGSGNWGTIYYETSNPSNVFNSSNYFIFMEGGDSSYDEFSAYMQANISTITSWVNNGGRLLIMVAPNNPLNSTYLALPGNIIIQSQAFYQSAASSAYATDISNAIFSGPNTTAMNFTGDFFAHGYFSGDNVQAIMYSNLNEIVLGQYVSGYGLMVYGTLTTDNFQLPQPAAHTLLENIISYTATIGI